METFFSPENAIRVAKIGLAVSAIVVTLRISLRDRQRHRLLSLFTHYLYTSKSPAAHKLYHKIHGDMPPYGY